MTLRTLALPALLATLALTGCAQTDHPSHASRCMEDDPCWSWPTMGNRTRGAQFKAWDGSIRTLVLSTCEWRVGMKAHTIDPTLNAPMRGDHWAAVHGCEGELF
jgi:hypothetical protein